MSDLVIHPLSLSPGPMGDISVHASVAAHDTTLDISNHHGARHVPRNIVSIAARDTSLEMVHPLKYPFFLNAHNTCHNQMPQNNADDKFTQIMRR